MIDFKRVGEAALKARCPNPEWDKRCEAIGKAAVGAMIPRGQSHCAGCPFDPVYCGMSREAHTLPGDDFRGLEPGPLCPAKEAKRD